MIHNFPRSQGSISLLLAAINGSLYFKGLLSAPVVTALIILIVLFSAVGFISKIYNGL